MHAQHRFSDATREYKTYLKAIPFDHEHRKMVVDAIRRCSNGLNLQYNSSKGVVENLGRQINTEFDEFNPIPSPNYSEKLYFSSIRPGNMGGARNEYGQTDEQRGQFFSDMFHIFIRSF